jgi:hypothetical protein
MLEGSRMNKHLESVTDPRERLAEQLAPEAAAEGIIAAADIARLAAGAPLAEGYRFVLLERAEIGALVSCIAEWLPNISVGSASCFLREEFYREKVFLPDAPDRDGLVLLLKHGDDLVGMYSCELQRESLSVYAALCVAAPQHRGTNLAHAGMIFTEAVGRHAGMGFIYGMATLRSPYAQSAFERAGWQLIGISPGYDRELVAPGIVKRVFEAIYCKVLVADAGLLYPQRHNLTPKTEAFFDWMLSTRQRRG